MTAQIPDTYRYKKKVYDIVAMTNPMGFNPRNYGLEPHSSDLYVIAGKFFMYINDLAAQQNPDIALSSEESVGGL